MDKTMRNNNGTAIHSLVWESHDDQSQGFLRKLVQKLGQEVFSHFPVVHARQLAVSDAKNISPARSGGLARRDVLRLLAASPLALTVDLERLVWTPGQMVAVPGRFRWVDLTDVQKQATYPELLRNLTGLRAIFTDQRMTPEKWLAWGKLITDLPPHVPSSVWTLCHDDHSVPGYTIRMTREYFTMGEFAGVRGNSEKLGKK